MQLMKHALLASGLLIMCNTAFSLGTSPWTTVDEIVQGPGNQPLIKLANPGNAVTGCTGNNWLRFVDAGTPVGKRQFSMLLTALSAGTEVTIRTDECSSDHPYIHHIKLRK